MGNETNSSARLPYLIPYISRDDNHDGLYPSVNSSQPPPPNDRIFGLESDVVVWAIIDGFLVVTILGGNTLTILALHYSRRLRSVISNMFVLSLALSDMVVGLTLPFHLAFYMTRELGQIEHWCLLRFFLFILACCVSIWNLTVIAIDRYLAIMYPLHYTRYMNKRVAIILLSCGWTLSTILAAIPMLWNNWSSASECEFEEVLPPWYVAGCITPLFSVVWACLLFAYFRIWLEASRQAKQLRNTTFTDRVSDWKSVQVVLLILGCFSICWLPYFIVISIQMFSVIGYNTSGLYKFAFSLAMANSGMNPLIYAWKNKNFRRAFALLLRCKNPNIAYREDCRIPPPSNNYHNNNNNNNQNNNICAATRAVVATISDGGGSSSSAPENASSISQRINNNQCCDPNVQNSQPIFSNINRSSCCTNATIICDPNSHPVEVVEEEVEPQESPTYLSSTILTVDEFPCDIHICQASESRAFSTTSSTGTEITDDSFEP